MTVTLTAEWNRQNAARAVPGSYWSPEAEAYCVDKPDARAAAVILKLFPDVARQHPHLLEMRATLLKGIRPFDNATPFYQAGGRLPAPRLRRALETLPVVDQLTGEQTGVGWQLMQFQEIDLAYANAVLNAHSAAYLGWERGLGKTLGAAALIDAQQAAATLVVAPNTAKRPVWETQLEMFLPYVKVIVLGNTAAQRAAAIERAQACYVNDQEFVLVVHYEALALIAGKKPRPSGKGVTILDGWLKLNITWDLMVTDEDHRLANMKAQWSRAADKVPAKKRLLLSGSIIQHHLEELYSPHHRAFPDRYSSKWRDWNDRFLDYVDTGGEGQVLLGLKPGREEALQSELGVWMTYRRKEDELDLPPKTHVEVKLDLSPSQRKVYDDLKHALIAELDDGTSVKVSNTGIAMLAKLRQVATGLDLVGNVVDSTKLDYAVELISDGADDEFVVFSWYKSAVYKLSDRLTAAGIEHFAVTGDTPQAKREEMIARFMHGEGQVFIGTLATLGESVNLQRANKVIRLDRDYNPMLNVQAEDRVFRIGQQRPVTIWDLVAKDTVDELRVTPALASKSIVRAMVLGA